MQVTTLTPRLSARRSTSARPMALVGSPSTASSAPTEPSSTRTTSSATGGSTLTAPLPKTFTPSTTRSLQNVTLLQETLASQATELPLSTPQGPVTPPSMRAELL